MGNHEINFKRKKEILSPTKLRLNILSEDSVSFVAG